MIKEKPDFFKRIQAIILVPKAGLEPARCRQQRILSPPRLPFHHFGINENYITIPIVKTQEKQLKP